MNIMNLFMLLFLIFSFCVFILSIINYSIAPNTSLGLFKGNLNCQYFFDLYEKHKDDSTSNDQNTFTPLYYKQTANICNRRNVMNGLEHACFTIDTVLGLLCTLLGLSHVLGQGKFFIKPTALIGVSCGFVCFLLTIVYVGYSGYIFNNDPSEFELLYENGAYIKLEGENYVYSYKQEDRENNYYYNKAKYKDLGKKQYNYDSQLYIDSKDANSDFSQCNVVTDPIPPTYIIKNNAKRCEYLWRNNYFKIYNNYRNKELYDRWLASIILSSFIFAFSICVSVFGLLIFLKTIRTIPVEHTPVVKLPPGEKLPPIINKGGKKKRLVFN